MIHEIGDLITLTSTITASDGTATLVVTDPASNATTSTGIVWANGYAGTYRPTVAGRFTVKWTTTNNVSQDVFDVRDTTNGIISLDDARTWLRLPAANTGDDEKIKALIETASDLIQDVTGPILTTTYTEQFSGGVPCYTVAHTPVVTVTKIDEYFGLSHLQLTEQPLSSQTTANGFTVDYATGEVTRRTMGGQASFFATGYKNCLITYTAKNSPIPAALQMACRELVRHLYTNTQVPQGKPRVHAAQDEMGNGPVPYAVPDFVLSMIPLKYRRPPGIA